MGIQYVFYIFGFALGPKKAEKPKRTINLLGTEVTLNQFSTDVSPPLGKQTELIEDLGESFRREDSPQRRLPKCNRIIAELYKNTNGPCDNVITNSFEFLSFFGGGWSLPNHAFMGGSGGLASPRSLRDCIARRTG